MIVIHANKAIKSDEDVQKKKRDMFAWSIVYAKATTSTVAYVMGRECLNGIRVPKV